MKRHPSLPATDRALQETRERFGCVCAPPISSEDREIADSFDVEAAIRDAREAQHDQDEAVSRSIRHGKMIERIRNLTPKIATETP